MAMSISKLNSAEMFLPSSSEGMPRSRCVRARPAFDIPLYYVCLAAAWICAFGRIESGRAARFLGALVIGCGVLGAAFAVFTAAAPPLPIFLPA